MKTRIKKILFYYPGKLNSRASGSNIRPAKMLETFIQSGYEVFSITGTPQERKLLINQAFSEIARGKTFDLVYFENLSTPLLLRWRSIKYIAIPTLSLIEIKFLLKCISLQLKIAYYFRDIHWMFDEIYDETYSKYRFQVTKFFGWLEIQFIKYYIKEIYVPCQNFSDYLYNKFGIFSTPLPPGSDLALTDSSHQIKFPLKFIYVGGCGRLYDPKVLFQAFNNLTKQEFTLTFCTRIDDWIKCQHNYQDLNLETIQIKHAQGRELKDLYKDANIAVYALPPGRYCSLASGLKFSEFISAGKPIMAYKGSGVSQTILSNDIGWVVDHNAHALRELLLKIKSCPEEIEQKRINVLKMREYYSWNRVAEIVTGRRTN